MNGINFIDQITTPKFAEKHNFLGTSKGQLKVEARGTRHLLRSKAQKDRQMVNAAKLIENETPRLRVQPTGKKLCARTNLITTQDRMVKAASKDKAKDKIERRLNQAQGNFADFSIAPFMKSLLWGSKGAFRLFGHRLVFHGMEHRSLKNDGGTGRLSNLAHWFKKIQFSRLTLANLHVTIHLFSQAVASKVLTGEHHKVDIFKNGGTTRHPTSPVVWKESVISAVGPLANMAFSSCLVTAATLFRNTLTLPVAIALGAGGSIWMAGELAYAVSSTKAGLGDFGDIAKNSAAHHALATAALIGQCALTLFACYKL